MNLESGGYLKYDAFSQYRCEIDMKRSILPRVIIKNCLETDIHKFDMLWIELGDTQSSSSDVKKAKIQTEYRDSYMRSAGEEQCKCFIALLDGETVGSARAYIPTNGPKLNPHRKIGIIGPCVVRKEVRRKGIGTLLIEHCFKYFKREKCDSVRVRVYCSNIPAMRFYEKFNFKAFGGKITLKLLQLWVRLGSKPLCARKLVIQMIKELNQH